MPDRDAAAEPGLTARPSSEMYSTAQALRDVVRADTVWAKMVARLAEKNGRMIRVLSPDKFARAKRQRSMFQELELERSRIARELHAGAGQPLAGIKLNLDILDDCSESMSPLAREAMRRLHRLAESALSEVRAVSHRLHPPDWQILTTEQAIRKLLAEMGAEACFDETVLKIHELPVEPGHSARIALYRCAQECIANVIRHSGATRLEVSLAASGDSAKLTVRDNGKGIEKTATSSGGLGLKAIRAHVSAAGGTCNINSGAEGTTITVSIPLSAEE